MPRGVQIILCVNPWLFRNGRQLLFGCNATTFPLMPWFSHPYLFSIARMSTRTTKHLLIYHIFSRLLLLRMISEFWDICTTQRLKRTLFSDIGVVLILNIGTSCTGVRTTASTVLSLRDPRRQLHIIKSQAEYGLVFRRITLALIGMSCCTCCIFWESMLLS